MSRQFGYRCEYCQGTVRAKRVNREAFKHKNGFVILENVIIGVCDRCGNRYYSADTLKQVEAIATGKIPPEGRDTVPVAQARPLHPRDTGDPRNSPAALKPKGS